MTLKTLKIFSYGGGVQSTAGLVLAAQGKIDYRTFLFCNVGDDSEHPGTLKYVREVALPYATSHGITLIELQKLRKGEPDTLYQHLMRTNRSIPIPMRMSGNGAPGRRSCTADFKIAVVDKWLREHGAKTEGAIVGLGISRDEFDRASDNKDPDTLSWKKNAFPLLYEVPRSLDRQDCINIIRDADLPLPPKSSCWFCPYHRLSVWQEMRMNEPELFWKSAELERILNERRARLGRDPIWLTRKLIPLAQATTELEQRSLFEEESVCDSGYCFMLHKTVSRIGVLALAGTPELERRRTWDTSTLDQQNRYLIGCLRADAPSLIAQAVAKRHGSSQHGCTSPFMSQYKPPGALMSASRE